MKEIKIAQFGVGPIGAEIVKYALQKDGIKIVGELN